jgi:hypothetical protein
MNENPFNLKRSDMKRLLTTAAVLTVIVIPAFAQPIEPDDALMSSRNSNVLQTEKAAVRQSGLGSLAMGREPGSSRVPQFDYRRGTSEYPYGPGYNFPYPDRPYGDPDHW